MTRLTRPRQLQPNKTWKIAVKPKSFPPRMQILKGKICLRFFLEVGVACVINAGPRLLPGKEIKP